MVTSLTELIVSLRKLNPTFTDDILRSHLINLGNSKEAVDDALRVVNGGNASDVLQNADRDMSKGVVFEEEQGMTKRSYGQDGGSSSTLQNNTKKPHHKVRNFFVFILLLVVLSLAYIFYFVDPNTLYSKLNQISNDIKSKFEVKQVQEIEGLLVENENDELPLNKDPNSNVIKQIQKISKIRSALNAYVGVYDSYPLNLLDITKNNTNKVVVQLPLLSEDDISDTFSGKFFDYKTDPKVGYNLSYTLEIPKNAIKSDVFYDLVEYRLVYNTKTKTSSFIPILKYVNGLNTATRDVVSSEAIESPIIDVDKNRVPDLLE